MANASAPYCVGDNITLIGSPVGGTFTIVEGAAFASINSITGALTTTGSGTIRVEYTVTDASLTCGTETHEIVLPIDAGCNSNKVNLSGTLWNDSDGNAQINGTEGTISNGMWVNLTDPNGLIIASVPVKSDGTYNMDVRVDQFSATGNYNMVVSNEQHSKGDLLNNGASPNNNYLYTGTHTGTNNNPSTATNSGKYNLGDLSTYSGNTSSVSLTPVNFGIQQRPTADVKNFNNIVKSAFSTTPPSGYPTVNNHSAMALSSSHLTGTINGGSLSGTDAEDCGAPSSCNTGTNSTFNIETINTGTQLYYDFGTGPQLIDVTGGPVTIPNFDASKLVIYAENGTGTSSSPIGFTYSITDKAGATSPAVPFSITTTGPLSVNLVSFKAEKHDNSVLLMWTTLGEHENKGFTIEHSTDYKTWKNIGNIGSKANNGNNKKSLNYQFSDNNPLSGLNLYRLKQTDFNGTASYSAISKIHFDNNQTIHVYPNATNGIAYVTGLQGSEKIQIVNSIGQIVMNPLAVAKK